MSRCDEGGDTMGTGHSTFEPEFKLFATGWLVWLDGPIARNQNIENGALKKGCNPFSFGSLKFDSCEVAGASYEENVVLCRNGHAKQTWASDLWSERATILGGFLTLT